MKPICRFIACSDVHYKENRPLEKERFEKGILGACRCFDRSDRPGIDALFVIGDFADSGSEAEMRMFKSSLSKVVRPETKTVLTMASHEYRTDGEENALKRFDAIFGQAPDLHSVICGFHFISITTERGCRIGERKQAWLRQALSEAAAENAKKPIFVFQHPHLSGTVYGSINWGEDDINAILMDYPQVIDFSGHSHAPVNDPRSIHQRFFTSVGTGSFSYFELDEFDAVTGTVPPDAGECAQFLIVEVYEDHSVRILPYDILTDRFFSPAYEIKTPWEPDSFIYTDDRYLHAAAPSFKPEAKPEACVSNGNVRINFPQAEGAERPDSYTLTVRDCKGLVKKQICIFSSYYLYEMPPFLSFEFTLAPGGYTYQIRANSFWRTVSAPIGGAFEIGACGE